MILDLGLIEYERAYGIQRELVARRRLGEIGDSIIIAEHPPVFTIGRSGNRKNLLADAETLTKEKIKFLNVDRGGDITFHGPGQIVAYPIIDLNDRSRDLHRYLRSLEDVAIDFLDEYYVDGERIYGKTGVWVKRRKIAFIGIAATNWITYHGLSININTDLRYFSMIKPCGLEAIEVTSLSQLLGSDVDMSEAKERLIRHFSVKLTYEVSFMV